jgi:hypothetical protein
VTCDASVACRLHSRLLPLTCSLHSTFQQVKDDDIQLLCANLGRFKRLKRIDLVSWGMRERGDERVEGESEAGLNVCNAFVVETDERDV